MASEEELFLEEKLMLEEKWFSVIDNPEPHSDDEKRALLLREESGSLAVHLQLYAGAIALGNKSDTLEQKNLAFKRLINLERMGIKAPAISADDVPPEHHVPWEDPAYQPPDGTELDVRQASILQIADYVATSWAQCIGVRYYSEAGGTREMQQVDIDDDALHEMRANGELKEAVINTYHYLAYPYIDFE